MQSRDIRLYHRLQLAAHLLQKFSDRQLSRTTITTAQAAVLSVITSEGNSSQRDIARALGINESATTTMVTRLLRDGLLERRRSTVDRRAWTLNVSKHGAATLQTARQSFVSVNLLLETALDGDDIERLALVLDKVSIAARKLLERSEIAGAGSDLLNIHQAG